MPPSTEPPADPTGPPGADPVWTRDVQPRRPPLSRADIVRAAIEIGDAEGLAAVSIRRIAARLDARAMSLYSHIDKKEDLLDLMVDELMGEILVPQGTLPTGWREAISAIVRLERAALLRHPWAVELIGQRTAIGPNRLRRLEQSLQALDELALPAETAMAVVSAVDQYTLGCVVREVMDAELHRRHGVTRADAKAASLPYLRRLATAEEFPRLAPLLERGFRAHPDPETRFERGLSWMLNGIAHDLAGAAPSAPLGVDAAGDERGDATADGRYLQREEREGGMDAAPPSLLDRGGDDTGRRLG